MKTKFYKLTETLLNNGGDTQNYTFDEIEQITEGTISNDYFNRRTFKWSTSAYQKAAREAGFEIVDVDYENRNLKIIKNDGSVVIERPVRSTTHHRRYEPIRAAISERALDPNDLGKDLDSAISYFKSNWRSTGPNPQYVPFCDKYNNIDDVYYHAGDEAYRASVKNRIPLFEGMPNRARLELRHQSIRYLAEQFVELFAKEDMSFDVFANWEHQIATHIREIYHEGGVNLYTYGNAQKLINVALKFVLSSNLVDYHHDVFKYCFFPIDGIIQRTLKSQLAVEFLHLNGQSTYYQPSWAKCDNWDDILDYQTRVRDAVLAHGYYSPIVWEATHWN